MSDAMIYVDLPTTRLLDEDQQKRLAVVLAATQGLGDAAPSFDSAELVLVMHWVMTGQGPLWTEALEHAHKRSLEYAREVNRS